MYQMYMPIAKELYEQINQMRTDGHFEAYGNITEQQHYEDCMYDKFADYTTSKTVGFENEANIGYALIKCLKTIDLSLAEKLKNRLNRRYFRLMCTGDVDAMFQIYFNYGKKHVKNILDVIDKYHKTLKDINESKLDKRILEMLPKIKNLLQLEDLSSEDLQMYADTFENANFDLSSFCDDIEYKMKKSFINNFNKDTRKTVEEIQANPSKLKRMEGQDFNLIIHSSQTPERFIENQYAESHKMLSTSLIDDKNIRCYQSTNTKFAFYKSIEEDDLISAFSGDAVTTFSKDGILGSFATPDYIPIKDFKNETRKGQCIKSYSEIMLKGNFRPNAIVCFDYATEYEVELAEKYDLDIILIETECYVDMLKPEDDRYQQFIKKADLSKYETANKL